MIIIMVQQMSSRVVVPKSHKELTTVQYMQSHVITVLTIHSKWQYQLTATCVSVVLSDSDLLAVVRFLLSSKGSTVV
jgi:hypothetical protein